MSRGTDALKKSIKCYDFIESRVLENNSSVKEFLSFQGVSLWEVVGPTLALYRFPKFWLSTGLNGVKTIVEDTFLRPYILRVFTDFKKKYRQGLKKKSLIPAQILKVENKGRKILFLAFNQSFFHQVQEPILSLLKKYENCQIYVLTDTEWSENLKIPFSSVCFINKDDFLSKERFKELTDAWSTNEQTLSLLISDNKLKESLIQTYGVFFYYRFIAELKSSTYSEFPKAQLYLLIASKILTHIDPSLIVSADDIDIPSRAFTLVSRNLGYKIFLLQQGATSIDYPEWMFLVSDRIAAMGPFSARVMIQQGVQEDKIILTGNPGFDLIHKISAEDKLKISKRLNLAKAHKTIVFFSQVYNIGAFTSNHKRVEMLQALCRVVHEFSDLNLIIKAHPAESLKELSNIFRGNQVKIVNQEFDINELNSIADVVMTFFSTASFPAMQINKQLISLNFPGSCHNNFFENNPFVDIIQNENELRNLLKISFRTSREDDVGHMKIKQSFVEDHFFKNDGRASQRIVDAMLALCDDHN